LSRPNKRFMGLKEKSLLKIGHFKTICSTKVIIISSLIEIDITTQCPPFRRETHFVMMEFLQLLFILRNSKGLERKYLQISEVQRTLTRCIKSWRILK